MPAVPVKLPKKPRIPQMWRSECEDCGPSVLHPSHPHWRGFNRRTKGAAQLSADAHNLDNHQLAEGIRA